MNMKFSLPLVAASFAMMATSSTAFAPGGSGHSRRASFVVARKVAPTRLYMAEETLEEEVERLVQDEIAKTRKVSNLRNANGVEYAPWMKMTEEDEEKIRKTIKARTEARRARREEETDVSGSLSLDSQFQELSGTGLRSKVINGNDVELEWATDSEKSTKGFIVKRRPAKTEGFATIASYKSDPLLASKGVDGGVYRYIDEDVDIGGYVYRITECESNGNENDLSQCLVEIQTAGEQRGTVVAVVALAAVAVATVLAGALLDPVQY